MYISQIILKGFRSLQKIEANLTYYTTLIGKNDSGKSSFLRALQLLFDVNSSLKSDDVCKFPDHDGELFIEGTLENCSNSILNLNNESVRIRRTFGNRPEWNYWGKVPRLDTLRKMLEGNLTKNDFKSESFSNEKVKKFADDNLEELCPVGRVSKETWQELYRRFEKSGFIEYEEGWCPLETEILSCLVQVIMLEADVRGEEEITGSGRSVLNQVGGILLRESTKNYQGIADAVIKLNSEISKVANKTEKGKWVLDELNNFESVLSEEVQRFDNTVTAQPTLTPPRIPSVEFAVSVSIKDEWIDGLDKMGHGLRRSVVFAMLRAHRRLREKTSSLEDESSNNSPLYLFLVEEPELYLHPQAERRRMKELKELSQDKNAQIILCTHSAIFVDLTEYKGILRFSRPDRKVSNVQGWTADDLKANDKKTLATTYRFDPHRSAMLFADLVILVEGQSEKVSIPHLAEKLNLESPDKEVEVVDCGSNSAIPVYQKVLESFGIKYVAWLDSDDDTYIQQAKNIRTDECGKIVITEQDWEKMAGISAGRQRKPFRSWQHFVHNNNEPNKKVKDRIIAAYSWQDFE